MFKNISRFIAISVAMIMILSLAMPTLLAGTRYSGDDRYATAVEISKVGWETGSNVVVLARGDVYADALAGVPLAYANEAPVLLTRPNQLPSVTKDEVVRLGASKVYILGGLKAVSQDVEDELDALGLEVVRISGDDRYGTAAAIAAEFAPNGADTVFLVFGGNFPDALAAASYAAAMGSPILLTLTDEIPEETLAALETLSPDQIFVIGGTSVISNAVLNALTNAERISGSDRYATAVALAQRFAAGNTFMYIASGTNESGGADAITGAALAARMGTGLLMVRSDLPDVVADYLRSGVLEVIIFGGNSAISQMLFNNIQNSLFTPSVPGPGPGPVGMQVTSNIPDSVLVGEETILSISTVANADAGKMVQAHFTLPDCLTLKYEEGVGSGDWRELTDVFGPSAGFPLGNVTTEFKATFTEVGTHQINVEFRNVLTGAVLSSRTFTVIVELEPMGLTHTASIFEVGVETEFTISTVANGYQGEMVRAHFALPDGVTLKYEEGVDSDDWRELTDIFGPSAGFPLGDVTTEFKAIFDEAGTYIIPVEFRSVSTGEILSSFTIEAEATADSLVHPGQSIQAAINAADPGDTIRVAPGTYSENLNVRKSINLIGTDMATVIIDATTYTAYGIYVKADDVSFSNFTFMAPTTVNTHTYGFKVENSSNINLSNITVLESNRTGVDLHTVIGAVIDSVVVQGTKSGVGIALTNSEDVMVTNTTTNGNAWGGIAIFTSGENIVIGAGNEFDVLYTQAASELPSLDLGASGIQYKVIDTARPTFTFYFLDFEVAASFAAEAATTVLSNLDGTEFYVVENMSMQAAIVAASAGDTINIAAGDYSITETVVVNKAVTVRGPVDLTAKITTTGGNAVFTLSAAATLENIYIHKTDKSNQAFVRITANGSTVKNSKFEGQYVQGDSEVVRAILPNASTDFTITGNFFESIRQPAYLQGSGNVSENFVNNTRGWVVCVDHDVTFTNNSFGENAVDIAIIANNQTHSDYFTDVVAISLANNGAFVENQLLGISAKDGELLEDR